jgi:hypothetical protein
MNQQEYQDTLKEQAMLAGEVHGHHSYVAGWIASQCVQMYELLTPEQQEKFSEKLLYSLDQLRAEQAGESRTGEPELH